jgi:hypothetical protein
VLAIKATATLIARNPILFTMPPQALYTRLFAEIVIHRAD